MTVTTKIKLNEKLVGTKVNKGLLHDALVAYLAGGRSGSANTKTRAEVRGGGKKPWRQKGTGRARAGSNASPLWRKGGVTFGPKPRSYVVTIPRQKKIAALKSALLERKDALHKLDDSLLALTKTKEVIKKMGDIKNKTLFVFGSKTTLQKAVRNIPTVDTVRAKEMATYHLLWADDIYFDADGWKAIEERISS